MRRSGTPDQSTLAGVAVLVLALVCAWRWWIVPSRAAAREAAGAELLAARTAASAKLAANEIAIAFDDRSAELRWSAPGECVEVYRVRIDERFRDPMVARFVGREEEHSSWLLALGRRGQQRLGVLVREDADDDIRERELVWSASEVGPAAPDFACRRRSWDPIEDALALGWPSLPNARVRVGDAWIGASVEGRCHETVCANEQGKFEQDRRCRARPWHEQLGGAGDGVALILSSWDDGHELDQAGISTTRTSLIHEGRPLWVNAGVEHRWSGVSRSLELIRIDDCSGTSLATADDDVPVAQVRARLDPKNSH
jgi:hypothetical protein